MRDYPHMQKNYARARELMARNGNPTQWGDTFPKDDVVRDDIAQRRAMLLVDEWADTSASSRNSRYAPAKTPPTITSTAPGSTTIPTSPSTASRPPDSSRHAARDCIAWALKHYGNVRADTHPNNKAMQHVLETSGFARCGLIQLLDRPTDTTRIAYQRHEW